MMTLSKSDIQKTRIGVLSVSMMGMAALAITPSYAAIATHFAVNNTMVQMLTSLPNLFMMIAGLVIGKLTATKISEKQLVIASILLVSVGGILPLLYHGSLVFLLFCSCLVGFGQGSCTNLTQVMITTMLPENVRQSTMGQSTTFTNLGGIVFIMGGGALASQSWINNYWIYLFSFLVLLVVLLLVPSQAKLTNETEKQEMIQDKKIKLNKYVGYISFWAFFTMLLNNVLNNNIALFIVGHHLGATSQAAMTSTISLIGGLLCGLVVGFIGKKFKYSTIAMSFLLYGFSFLIISFANTLLLAIIGSFLVGAAMSIAMAQYPYLLSISVDKTSLSMALGIWAAVYSVGGVLSPFLINPLTSAFEASGLNVFSVSGILALVISGIVFAIGFQKNLVKRADRNQA